MLTLSPTCSHCPQYAHIVHNMLTLSQTCPHCPQHAHIVPNMLTFSIPTLHPLSHHHHTLYNPALRTSHFELTYIPLHTQPTDTTYVIHTTHTLFTAYTFGRLYYACIVELRLFFHSKLSKSCNEGLSPLENAHWC